MSHPSPARRPWARMAYVVGCLTVLLASAWALARRVQDPAWPEAAAALAGRVGPTEVVVLLPASAALETRHFGDLPVLAGMPSDPSAFGGLWIVAGPGAEEIGRRALFVRFGRHESVAGDGYTLLHLSHPRESVFDLVERFDKARVWRERGDETERCDRWRSGGHNRPGQRRRDCPGEWWRDVGVHEEGFGGERARGVWLHPIEGGWTTVLHYPRVPAGAQLLLRLGLDDGARKHREEPAMGPVRVVVRQDGQLLSEIDLWTHDDLRTDLLPLRAPTSGDGKTFDLAIETTAGEDHFANLHVLGEVLR